MDIIRRRAAFNPFVGAGATGSAYGAMLPMCLLLVLLVLVLELFSDVVSATGVAVATSAFLC